VANSPQALKRARQAEKRRQRNASQRSMMRTYIKKVRKALLAGDKDGATAAYKDAVPMIDRMVGKGLLHKNAAARYKSRMNTRVREL
jgi:small subunit ribosomal protein S20